MHDPHRCASHRTISKLFICVKMNRIYSVSKCFEKNIISWHKYLLLKNWFYERFEIVWTIESIEWREKEVAHQRQWGKQKWKIQNSLLIESELNCFHFKQMESLFSLLYIWLILFIENRERTQPKRKSESAPLAHA